MDGRANGRDEERGEADVIVLGAGAAGLACASVLDRAGRRVLVLEARDRIGGRVHTIRPDGWPVPVELGAEFVHGAPAELTGLARACGAELAPAAEAQWVADERGLRPAPRFEGDVGSALDAMSETRDPDRSVAEFLAEWCRGHPERAAAAERARRFIEGFHAADPERASERALARENALEEEQEDAEQDFRLPGGYDRLLQHLHDRLGERCTLRLTAPVAAVRWRPGAVEVQLHDDARVLRAGALVVTLPLGVLQAAPDEPGAVRFDPEPPGKRDALALLGMGAARRTVLRLREPLLQRAALRAPDVDASPREIGFVHAVQAAIPVWWPPTPLPAPMLTGWLGGPGAAMTAGVDEHRMVAVAIDALATALRLPRDQVASLVIAGHSHDWSADPYARGAYSYTLVGGIDARRQLAEPTERTLFWAGEATHDGGAVGTVHGALASGHRAGKEVLGDR